MGGLRGEGSIAELCRREGISQGIHYKWSKDFMEAGKRRLAGDAARAANTGEVKDLRREARDLKEVVAEQTLELRLVEESHLSARMTLTKLGIPRTTFYRWYDRYLQRGEAGLQDQPPKPRHVWNRIPDEVRRKVVKLAMKETELSPRELAVTFTDTESYLRLSKLPVRSRIIRALNRLVLPNGSHGSNDAMFPMSVLSIG